ncbi:MAG: hypothetical protein JW913_04780 [Chitinispirillaceae bacterium]|nr:hypothetical protein [Chitinispirillaceae bacterium]
MKNFLCLLSAIAVMSASAQQPIGWASENGGTTGGAGGKTVTVKSAADLTSNAKSGGAMIIRVSGKITVDRVDVASNKTIEGAEKGATIDGSLKMGAVKNIIIRNLVISKSTGSFEDVVQMQKTQNVWIDHCDISDKRSSLDGLCDMTHAVNYVTISWTKFSYSSSSASHRFCMLISHSDDNEAEDLGKLKITLHHNWWAENVTERMPRMRFCQVHSFNNYFSSKGNNYCIGAGKKAQVLVESNYFDNVNRPHFFYDNNTTATIKINDDNQYPGCSGDKDEGQGTCFTPSYTYKDKLDKGSEVKDIVMKGAGPQFGVVEVEQLMENNFHIADAGLLPMDQSSITGFTLSGRNLPVSSFNNLNIVPNAVLIRRNGSSVLEINYRD